MFINIFLSIYNYGVGKKSKNNKQIKNELPSSNILKVI